VDLFKSKLDEGREADLLLHVVDISHPEFEDHIESVNQTLLDIKANDKPVIMVFNKIDAYKHLTIDEDDLMTEKTPRHFTLEEWKQTWMHRIGGENALFISAKNKENFKKTANKEATLFGMLGWETGLIVKEILHQYQQNNTNAATVVPALCKVTYNSPCGWMKLDPGNYHTCSPSYLVSWSANGKTKEVNELLTTENECKEFTEEQFPEDTSSGWRNTYLCI